MLKFHKDRHVLCNITPMKPLNYPFLFLLTFLTSFEAYSAPACSSFIQPRQGVSHSSQKASDIGFQIQDLIKERRFGFTSGEGVFTLNTNISLGLMFSKPARLNILIRSNNSITIEITPKNPKHIGAAKTKLERIFNELSEDFSQNPKTEELIKPEKTFNRYAEPSISMSFERGISSRKVKMVVQTMRILLKLSTLPNIEYWSLEIAEPTDDGKIYHIPKHLINHQTPSRFIGAINHKAIAYAIPLNLPENVRRYFEMSRGFKLILDSSLWTVEAVFKTPSGKKKTLILEITPDKALVLDMTPYATHSVIGRDQYLHQEIIEGVENGSLKTVSHNPKGGYLSKLYVDTNNLIEFLKELEEAGFELDIPDDGFFR